MTLNPSVVPSSNFNLTDWKITLPIDASGGILGTAIEVKSLSGYQHPHFFYTGSDGAMVFYAPVEGATTRGSKYARSELREMSGTSKAAWSLAQGGFMSATLEVDMVPTYNSGSQGRVVVGQIHGHDDELVRLYWEKGTIYFVNDHAGPSNVQTTFKLTNAAGQSPDISLDERFSYTFEAKGSDLKVSVIADGQLYMSTTRISSAWDSDTFYFKAGTYLGVNESQGTGAGQTSFYALDFSHSTDVSGEQAQTLIETPNGVDDIANCALQYIASYDDLSQIFGANAAEACKHFASFGLKEGRPVLFDGLEYIASYADLIQAFGVDAEAGAAHYISYGRSEMRQTTFNSLEYIASHADLIWAFGVDAEAGAAHYIQWGREEGRRDSFDPQAYIECYTDLQMVFGNDLVAATKHYITYGFYEGRVWI
jgi:hypothetical protein